MILSCMLFNLIWLGKRRWLLIYSLTDFIRMFQDHLASDATNCLLSSRSFGLRRVRLVLTALVCLVPLSAFAPEEDDVLRKASCIIT